MIVFADSSAVVTRYAPTEASNLPTAATVVVSALARVEVVSALWRKAELHELSHAQAGRLVRYFESEWRRGIYQVVHIGPAVLTEAAALTGSHRLRSLDAIQLACAVAVRAAEPACETMVVLDERLRRAAATERFALLPA